MQIALEIPVGAGRSRESEVHIRWSKQHVGEGGGSVHGRVQTISDQRTWLHIYILTCRLGARVLRAHYAARGCAYTPLLMTSASCVPKGGVFFVAGELELRVDVDSEVIACVGVDIRVVGCACGVPARPA